MINLSHPITSAMVFYLFSLSHQNAYISIFFNFENNVTQGMPHFTNIAVFFNIDQKEGRQAHVKRNCRIPKGLYMVMAQNRQIYSTKCSKGRGGAGVGVKGVFNNVKNCKIGKVGHPLHEPVISFDFSQCFDVICVTIRIERRPIVTFGHWHISHLFTLNDNYGHYFSFRLTRRVDIIFFAIQVEFKDQQHYTNSSRNHNQHNFYLLASSFR